MKRDTTILLALLMLYCNSSCRQKASGNSNNRDELNKTFDVNPEIIFGNYTTWYNYAYFNVPLSRDFVGLNTDSAVIDKAAFLNLMIQEKAAALKIRLLDGKPVYKLYTLSKEKENISNTAAHMAEIEMKNYRLESREIPEFSFTDLNGTKYDKTSAKGKIVILKCWFIHCVACVKEFPECNKLVEEYSGRNDMLFVSLALDKKEALEQFLKTKTFTYAVIPDIESYIHDSLKVTMYPTHLLINKNGKIVKVVNSLEELKPFLKKEAGM